MVLPHGRNPGSEGIWYCNCSKRWWLQRQPAGKRGEGHLRWTTRNVLYMLRHQQCCTSVILMQLTWSSHTNVVEWWRVHFADGKVESWCLLLAYYLPRGTLFSTKDTFSHSSDPTCMVMLPFQWHNGEEQEKCLASFLVMYSWKCP